MKKHQSFFIFLLGFFLFCLSCSDNKERKIVIDTPRELTIFDQETEDHSDPVMSSKGAEKEPAPQKYNYQKADAWTELPTTPFRLLNFSFETDGEVYLSESRGGVIANVNRWLGQFGSAPLDSLDSLEKISMLSGEAYFVSAVGSFKGMRMPVAKSGYKLIGVLMEKDGALITIKMTGPANEVDLQEAALREFCQSLRLSK